jgi:hypothetical protein
LFFLFHVHFVLEFFLGFLFLVLVIFLDLFFYLVLVVHVVHSHLVLRIPGPKLAGPRHRYLTGAAVKSPLVLISVLARVKLYDHLPGG